MKYTVITSGQFKKAYKRCLKRGLNGQELLDAVAILAETGTLPATYKPHKLSGKYSGCWECHLQPDWLLIWQQNDTELVLILVTTGSHSDVF